MTWGEWVNSSYNPGTFALGTCGICGSPCTLSSSSDRIVSTNHPDMVVHHEDGVSQIHSIESKENRLVYWEEEYHCHDEL